jgi:hypothetical protein
MYSYADVGIVTIPVNEKKPVINDWNNPDRDLSYERIDKMFADKFKEVTGLAVLIGSANLSLSCVDIDTHHEETINKIVNALPSQVNKRGRKGCSFFFQSKDQEGILKFICPDGFIEIFYSNKYVVIPPSLHSREDIGDHQYSWVDESCTLLSVGGIDGLPFIEHDLILNINLLCNNSVSKVNKNQPIQVQYDINGIADGRYNAIGMVIGSYIKRKNGIVNISELVETLIKFDSITFPNNSFFEYNFNKKHKEIKKGVSSALNAFSYAQSFLVSIEKKESLIYAENKNSAVEVESYSQFREFVEIGKKELFRNEFKEELIPPLYRKFCNDLSSSFGVSLQSVFYPLLGAHAGVLQSKFIIRPNRKSTFFQRPNLGMILLANSGSKKSDIIKMLMWKNNQLNSELKNSNSKDLLEKQIGITKRIEAQTKNKVKAYESGDQDSAESIVTEIYGLQDELTELMKSINPTVWLYHSATIQKIIKDHADNSKNGLFFIADEFSTYLSLMNKKGNEEYRSYVMECLNGDASYSSSTLSRGTDHIDNCFASFLSTLQPDVFNTKINDLHNPRLTENDGFWQRFIFITMGKPSLDRKGEFNVLDYKKEYNLFEHGFMSKIREISIDNDALEYYDLCRKKIELRAYNYFGTPVGSFLAKHEGRLCKYAFFAEWFISNGRCLSISKESIDYAMLWLEFEGNDIIQQFIAGKEEEDTANTLRIIDMIMSGILVDGETVSKWHQMCKGIFRSMDYFLKYIKILENHGYISMIEIKSNSKIVKVNPLMRCHAN